MTLVYRSILRASDASIVDTAGDLFVRWLAAKGYDLPPEGLGEAAHQLVTSDDLQVEVLRSSEVLDDGSTITRMRLEENSTSQGRWVTRTGWVRPDESKPRPPSADADTSGEKGLAAVEAPRAPEADRWLWIELEHDPLPGQPTIRPGSPRFVRELLAAGEATDGVVPLTAEPWTITRVHIPELARYILDPRRRVPILVFAADARRAYDQARLASLLARDLAGVAAVYQLSDGEATQGLAQALPEGYAIFAGGLRTYLPGCAAARTDGTSDDPGRHRTLSRATLSGLGARAFPAVKDQVLALSTRRRLPALPRRTDSGLTTESDDAPAVAPSQTIREPRPSLKLRPSSGPLSVAWFQERLGRVLAHLGQSRLQTTVHDEARLAAAFDDALEALLADPRRDPPAQPAPQQPTPETDEAAAQRRASARLVEQRELYDALLADADREREAAHGDLELLRMELEDLQLDATETSATLESAERRVRWLERRLRELGDAAIGEADQLPAAPPSVSDALELASLHLPHIVIGDTRQSAAELDLYAASQMFAIKSWQALLALNDYARTRASGEFDGSFVAWCQNPPPGHSAISANAVAPGESQTVDQTPALRSVRVFEVPPEVASSGEVYMAAHVRIAKRTAPAPRLHFHDDAAKTGRIYVGYLGAHLPTARFT